MAEETHTSVQAGDVISMKQLLEAGVHFGHQISHWNPKMKEFIFGSRNGIHIIDLQQTVGLFKRSYDFVRNVVADGGEVLFVGTKKQAQGIISEEAARAGMPYINTRWLGGTLTNFHTIRTRVDYLLELKKLEEEGQMERLPKKEAKGLMREIQKLEHLLGGIVNMKGVPKALYVVDTRKEHIAVNEAKILGIPIVAVIDTNSDPADADYIIPSNDDAIRAIKLFTSKVAEACIEGKHVYEEKLQSGEVEQKEEDTSRVVVEKKVFVFKEYGEEREKDGSTSVAVSESAPGEATAAAGFISAESVAPPAKEEAPAETAGETAAAPEAEDKPETPSEDTGAQAQEETGETKED